MNNQKYNQKLLPKIDVPKKCNSNPIYNPSKWTNNFYVQNSHNCYAYALDDLDINIAKTCKKIYPTKKTCVSLRPKPGAYNKYNIPNKERMTCKGLRESILKDNKEIYKINSNNKKCKSNYYKIAFAVQPKMTYHFYRQDNDCSWSHKDGPKKPTQLDTSKKKIYDPKFANRKYDHVNYSDFCGYLCVPENHYKKTNMTY